MTHYRRPIAQAKDSGMARSLSMAAMPNIGPTPNIAKAGPQPQESATIGVNQMGGIVNRNPIPVWKVNAVPR